jgi:hypothetical protein
MVSDAQDTSIIFTDSAEREEDGEEPEQQAKVKANGMCAEYGQGGVRAPE